MYRRALHHVAGYTHARAALAALAASRGNHREAVREYKRVTERLPLPAYFIALAQSLDTLGLHKQAAAAFERAEAIIRSQSANGVQTELALAELLLARGGNPGKALALARKGFRAAPNTKAEATLAHALLENGQCRRARAHSIRSLRLGTRNVAAFEHRSRIETCLGNDRAAAEWLERARA